MMQIWGEEMKYIQILRILTLAIVLSVLSATIPVASVQAAASITISPEEGNIGAKVTVTGTGFNKSTETTDKYAIIYFSSQKASTLDDIDSDVNIYEKVKEGIWLDEDGEFEVTFNVPESLTDGTKDEDVTDGTYYIYVCHYLSTTPPTVATRIRAVATFMVTMGDISLSSYSGLVGSTVEIKGSDFSGNKNITIKYDEYTVPIESGDRKSKSSGSFTSIISVPDSTSGLHTITAVVSGTEAEAEFYVTPKIVTSPTTGEAGTAVMVNGTGFGRIKTVTVLFQGIRVALVTTNVVGSFSANFNVPQLGAGLYSVDCNDGTNGARAHFTIVASPPPTPAPEPTPVPPPTSISINATTGNVGKGLVMGGAGFKANGIVTVKYDDEVITTVTTDDNGVFAAAFTIPVSQYGDHTIIASDGTNAKDITFTVESIPPPVPALLRPETGAEVKSPLSFVWSDVTDDSQPVTYTLQVAVNEDFSATSMAFEKAGLTESGYTFTREENLRLACKEAHYYWRVRAVDGASNEGRWAYPGTFDVAVASALPGWALYTLIALGCLIFFALGYLVRMRTSGLRE